METIYIKKITKQDITKSYSPSKEATRDFFFVDLNMINDYVGIDICYYGKDEYPSDITIHKAYQGSKDWRICGDNFKPLYAFRNPEEGDLSVWRRVRKNDKYKFSIEIVKKQDSEYTSYSRLFSDNDNHLLLKFEDFNNNSLTQNSTKTPSQIIYYGVPGSGKSHKIDEKTKTVPDEQKMRVVFHPEYTNADFVGQIVPRVDDGVDYRFKAGPFSRILKRAYQNIDKPFYLIIEEINRGNASAIFGDLFQLLDRDESGYSKYSVENLDINSYIRSEGNLYNDKEVPLTVKVGNTEWTEITGIRLPPNLSILATMNTSDQNVFALDNAFQRRWDMQLVENKFTDDKQKNTDDKQETTDDKQKNAIIEVANQKISWGDFQTTINSYIGSKSNESGLSSMEDKRLGCWFVKSKDGKIDTENFKNKVLKYLWDDTFKFSRQDVFVEDIKSLEELQNQFLTDGFKIFKDECKIKEKIESVENNHSNSDTTTQTTAEKSSENV